MLIGGGVGKGTILLVIAKVLVSFNCAIIPRYFFCAS